jgi:hypothetical protein
MSGLSGTLPLLLKILYKEREDESNLKEIE